MSDQNGLPLVAYALHPRPAMEIVPAAPQREWMNRTPLKFANRCLPLKVAAESGWLLLNPVAFRATWNGGPEISDVAIEPVGLGPVTLATSHFGSATVTFSIPYLFRTPPGFSLQVRGPVNEPKDGIFPLDGVVETDWLDATFTMNWIFTRPGTVEFVEGEPIAMVVPVRRGDLEAFVPVIRPLASDPEVQREHRAWSRSRAEFGDRLRAGEPEATQAGWQRDYTKGRTVTGEQRRSQTTRLNLRPFTAEGIDA